jgi:hypothetical protein
VIGAIGRVLGILALTAMLLAVVIWVALGIDLSVELWSDECVFDDTSCAYGADYDVLGVIQLLILLGGGALAGVSCVRGIRRLASGRPAERLLRRSLQALAIFIFWFLGPFMLLAISQQ